MSLEHAVKRASPLLFLALMGWAGTADAQVVGVGAAGVGVGVGAGVGVGVGVGAAGVGVGVGAPVAVVAPIAAVAPVAAIGTPFLGLGSIVSPVALGGVVAPALGAVGIAPFGAFAPAIATSLGLTPFLGTLNDAAIAASLLGVNNAFALQLQGAAAFTMNASFTQFVTAGIATFGGFGAAFNPLLTQIGLTPVFTGFANQLLTAFPVTCGIGLDAAFPGAFATWWIPQLQSMLSVINLLLLPNVVSPIIQDSLVTTQFALMNTLNTAQQFAIAF